MIYLLVFILLVAFVVSHFYDCDIIVNPIKGIMFGALYNDEDFDDETDHTIQVLILIISFTFIWTTSNGSKK
jgi:hypothetical protein